MCVCVCLWEETFIRLLVDAALVGMCSWFSVCVCVCVCLQEETFIRLLVDAALVEVCSWFNVCVCVCLFTGGDIH